MTRPWPTGDDLRSWIQKRGEVNRDTSLEPLQDEVIEDVIEFVQSICHLSPAATAIPGPIHKAIVIEAYSVYHRRQAPEGVAGSGEHAVRWGRFDATAATLLTPYIPPRIGIV